MKRLQYIEIDIDTCANTYGVAPCTASIGSPGTGSIKCFNCKATCQDVENLTPAQVTLRFTIPTAFMPSAIPSIPSIQSIKVTPAIISLGKDLGQRGTLAVTFGDHRHTDVGDGYDPYVAERDYDPWTQGTYWGRFRARYPFLLPQVVSVPAVSTVPVLPVLPGPAAPPPRRRRSARAR